jgi:nitrite reductase/ring-hydroxylating ferredoxin subunit
MRKGLSILAIVGCISIFMSCTKQNEFYDIPNVAISDFIYLSNPTNFELQVQGGYVYRQAGYKGLIIYRRYMNFDDNDFVAYERACPIHYSESCSTMKVVDDLTIVCECDGKEYSLFDGSPFANNPSPSVKFYRTTFDGINTIHVTN